MTISKFLWCCVVLCGVVSPVVSKMSCLPSLQLRVEDGGVCAGGDVASVDGAPVGLVLTGHHTAGAHQGADGHHQREQK